MRGEHKSIILVRRTNIFAAKSGKTQCFRWDSRYAPLLRSSYKMVRM
jgi:hypothetical protein